MTVNKSILLLGSSGFIGKEIKSLIKNKKNYRLFSPSKQKLNLNHPEKITEFVLQKKISTVINAAGISKLDGNFKKIYNYNLNKILSLLSFLNNSDYKGNFVQLSSSLIYEPNKSSINEKSKLNPYNPYTITKIATDYFGLYSDLKFNYISLRVFNATGINQNKKYLIPKIFNLIKYKNQKTIKLKNLHPVRDFIDVRDVARAVFFILKIKNFSSFINISSGKGTSIESLVKKINKLYDNNLNFIFSDTNPIFDKFIGNNKKLTRLGFKFKYSIDDTLRNFKRNY